MKPLHESTLAIIGLGYVGLPLAVEFGKQYPTIGFDINAARVNELRGGSDHTLEVSVEDLKAATQLTYTSHLKDMRDANVFIVTVPTPIDAQKCPDLRPLIGASESIGKVLNENSLLDLSIFEKMNHTESLRWHYFGGCPLPI